MIAEDPGRRSINFMGAYLIKAAGLELSQFHQITRNLANRYPVYSVSGIENAQGQTIDPTKADADPLVRAYQLISYDMISGRKAAIRAFRPRPRPVVHAPEYPLEGDAL